MILRLVPGEYVAAFGVMEATLRNKTISVVLQL